MPNLVLLAYLTSIQIPAFTVVCFAVKDISPSGGTRLSNVGSIQEGTPMGRENDGPLGNNMSAKQFFSWQSDCGKGRRMLGKDFLGWGIPVCLLVLPLFLPSGR